MSCVFVLVFFTDSATDAGMVERCDGEEVSGTICQEEERKGEGEGEGEGEGKEGKEEEITKLCNCIVYSELV